MGRTHEPCGAKRHSVGRSPEGDGLAARALDADQVARILKGAEGTRLYGFFVLAAMTGMRRGEIGALTWDAIDLEAGKATVRQAIGEDRKGGSFLKSTKSGRERIVPLNSQAVAVLRAHRNTQAWEKRIRRGAYDDRGFVFADEIGGMLDLDARQQDVLEAGGSRGREGSRGVASLAPSLCCDHGSPRRLRRSDGVGPARPRLSLDDTERLRARSSGRPRAGRS